MSFAPTAIRRIAQTSRIMAPASSVQDAYILSAARTPIGSFNGALKKLSATELGITAVKAAIERAGLKPENVEEVLMGNVIQANVGQSPARQVALGAGCPDTTEATTINKVCASGMKSISFAAQSIQLGQRNVIVAGGMESMSNAPFYITRQNPGFGNGALTDSLVKDGLFDVYNKFPMGNCAEKTAKDHNLSREDQDAFAIDSYKRSAEAWKAGAFKNEIAPVVIADKKGSVTVEEDEEYKNVKFDKVPTLRPVFDPKGTVTAANASTINDGASAVVVVSQEEVQKRGLKPLAKIICEFSLFFRKSVHPLNIHFSPPISLRRRRLRANRLPHCSIESHPNCAGTGGPQEGGHCALGNQRGLRRRRPRKQQDPRTRPGQGQQARRWCQSRSPHRKLWLQDRRHARTRPQAWRVWVRRCLQRWRRCFRHDHSKGGVRGCLCHFRTRINTKQTSINERAGLEECVCPACTAGCLPDALLEKPG